MPTTPSNSSKPQSPSVRTIEISRSEELSAAIHDCLIQFFAERPGGFTLKPAGR